MQRLRDSAEKAKIELSTTLSTDINLPYVAEDSKGPKHLEMTINRAKLEELVRPIVEKCKESMIRANDDAKWDTKDVYKIILVGGPTRMPIVQKFVEEVMEKPPERGVDPMECVAMGAAIQAGVLAGEVKDLLLLDVTPLSLGVETLGGVLTKVIERNTTIPTKKSQIFTTAADGQTSVTVHVLQGERSMAADNVSLGNFILTGIAPAPRGVPQIEVTFDINADGILDVSAKDLATDKEQKITITASTKLKEDDIDKMVKEAEKFAEQDKKKKEEVELRNQADSIIYTTRKTIEDLGDKITKDQKEKLEKATKELEDALSGKDLDKIKKKVDSLTTLLQQIGATVYQQAASKQAKSDKKKTSQKKNKEKVVNADYKVVDKDKK